MKKNSEYYTPNKIYTHKSILYTCKFIGYQGNKPTYEIVTTNEISGFKVGDKFTPNDPEKWFDITDTFIPPTPVKETEPAPTPTSKEGLENGGFTPGEWGAYYNSEEFPGQAAIYGCDGDTNGRVIAVLDTSDQTDMANIDLICAAPAMYEALKDCLKCLTMDSDMEEDFAPEIKKAKTILTRINKD